MTPPVLVDTHAHLVDKRLSAELSAVLGRAAGAGVIQVVSIATGADDSRNVLAMADEYQGVFAAVGIHPNDVTEAAPGDWSLIETLARQPRVVAIGETGLDRYWKKTPFADQQTSFDRHLRLALDLDLPIVIHSRDCMGDIIEQLEGLGRPVKGILHSFTGTSSEAERLVGLGLYISFAGMLTFANKGLDPLREAARRVPEDRLLVETDSPYLSPEPFRGKLNEPSRVVETARRLAELRGVSFESIAESTTANARRLFRLPELGDSLV